MARRGWRALGGALGAALVLLAASPPALAQSEAANKDATEVQYNAGLEAAKQGNWPKAYESFLSAWKLREHPQIAANLGRAELKTGRHRDAAEHLAHFLREAKDASREDRAAVQKMLDEAKGKIGTLVIKVNRPGAEVLLDGQVVGLAPVSREIYVEAGTHTVEARLGSEKAEPVTVELAAGASRHVGVVFGAERANRTSAGADEEESKPPPGDEKTGSGVGRKVVIGVGIGLTVVAAGAGAALGAMALVKQGERNDSCLNNSCPSQAAQNRWVELNRERNGLGGAAIGALAATALLGVSTIVYASVSGAPERDAPVQVGLMLPTDGAGLVLGRAW